MSIDEGDDLLEVSDNVKIIPIKSRAQNENDDHNQIKLCEISFNKCN